MEPDRRNPTQPAAPAGRAPEPDPARAPPLRRGGSLKAKVTVLTASLIALTALGTTAFLFEGQRAAGRQDLAEYGAALAAMVAQNCEYGVYTRDPETLRQLVDATFAHGAVAYLAVRDPAGEILHARTQKSLARVPHPPGGRPGGDEPGQPPAEVAAPGGATFLDLWEPVHAHAGAVGSPLEGGQEKAAGGPGEILGYVQLGVSFEGLQLRLRRQLLHAGAFAGAVVVLGLGLSFLVARRITSPLRELEGAAAEIAAGEGDLTRSFRVASGDEVGALAESFSRFIARLRDMVRRTRDAAAGLDRALTALGACAREVREGAASQVEALDQSLEAVGAIGSAVEGIAQSTSALVVSAEQSAGAVTELGASSQEIAGRMGALFREVGQVSSTLKEISGSGQQIAESVEVLSASTAGTAAAIQQLNASVKAIRASAEQTGQLSQEAASSAEAGGETVGKTIEGIGAIRETVDRVGTAIEELAARCGQIGISLNVIEDVAEQTGLMALNAAILAAQAGEHGRGFAVLASEIGELAERTGLSAGEVSAVVEGLQRTSREAVRAMREAGERVRREVERSESSRQALHRIRRATGRAAGQVQQIAAAAEEQSRSADEITRAVQRVAASVEAIAATIQQQVAATAQLSQAADTMRAIASEVHASVGQQADGTQEIARNVESVRAWVERIDEATREQSFRARQVADSVSGSRQVARHSAGQAEAMDRVLSELGGQMEALRGQIRAFKI